MVYNHMNQYYINMCYNDMSFLFRVFAAHVAALVSDCVLVLMNAFSIKSVTHIKLV